jgi:hypothetical protein
MCCCAHFCCAHYCAPNSDLGRVSRGDRSVCASAEVGEGWAAVLPAVAPAARRSVPLAASLVDTADRPDPVASDPAALPAGKGGHLRAAADRRPVAAQAHRANQVAAERIHPEAGTGPGPDRAEVAARKAVRTMAGSSRPAAAGTAQPGGAQPGRAEGRRAKDRQQPYDPPAERRPCRRTRRPRRRRGPARVVARRRGPWPTGGPASGPGAAQPRDRRRVTDSASRQRRRGRGRVRAVRRRSSRTRPAGRARR